MKRFVALLAVLFLSVPAFSQSPTQSIADIAIGNPNFSTLVSALQAAGLVDTLRGPGPYTVFAPTNDAFAKLAPGTLNDLLRNPTLLRQTLLYHVVPGRVLAQEVVGLNGQSVNTVAGNPVTIRVSGGSVMVNNANVVTTDILASNGVIHVIDTVLVPDSVARALAAGK